MEAKIILNGTEAEIADAMSKFNQLLGQTPDIFSQKTLDPKPGLVMSVTGHSIRSMILYAIGARWGKMVVERSTVETMASTVTDVIGTHWAQRHNSSVCLIDFTSLRFCVYTDAPDHVDMLDEVTPASELVLVYAPYTGEMMAWAGTFQELQVAIRDMELRVQLFLRRHIDARYAALVTPPEKLEALSQTPKKF